MMVTIIPFTILSQKRSSKLKNDKSTESVSKSGINFMIIKGIEFSSDDPKELEKLRYEGDTEEYHTRKYLKPKSKIYIHFDFGTNNLSKEHKSLHSKSKEFRTMVDAVNKATEYGWEFINSTVIFDGNANVHYYYMKKR